MSKQTIHKVIIPVDVQTTLTGMDELVNKLKTGLESGTAKIDMGKGAGASLLKTIKKFKEEYANFSKMTSGDQIAFGDSKEAIASGGRLVKLFKQLQLSMETLEKTNVLDAKKMFPDLFDSRLDGLRKKLDGFKAAADQLSIKRIETKGAEDKLRELEDEGKRLQGELSKELSFKIDTTELDKAAEEAKKKAQEIRTEWEKKLGAKLTAATDTESAANKAFESKTTEVTAARKKREAAGFATKDFSGSGDRATYKGMTAKQVQSSKELSEEQKKAIVAAIKAYGQEETAIKKLSSALDDAGKKASQLRKIYENLGKTKTTELVTAVGGSQEDYDRVTASIQAQTDATNEAEAAHKKNNATQDNIDSIEKKIKANTAAYTEQSNRVNKLREVVGQLETKVSTTELQKAFKEAGVEGFNAELLETEDGIEKLRQKLNAMDQVQLDNLIKSLQGFRLNAEETEDYVEKLKEEIGGIGDKTKELTEAEREMQNLKNSFLQFFSLTNSVQLFKRAVTSAMNTVKELDATMTEAAVVTDFSIGDMWDQLPEYSAQANKLGVAINDMYGATTLYYQQGLKTNEAMALGVETMKMAKIAGMESTEATKAMTSALRGFNMELNETSATRVNDVYSQLAAVTAADTNQIATAMEKTASIAAAANMEFETTAAFLAQIIETTQEAPETAGTALKTIIARFSEVKSLREQGLLAGEDSEGEGIDVNKIQTALRSVGISMEGFFAGTEGLDSILMKLAEKWGSLDFETQRYIATMAAGSRQQSRFIAMMSDYARTQELVGEAQNSVGASQRQYEKTLESMGTKLQKLKNAWDEFTMAITDSGLLKFAVDFLTTILTSVNKLGDYLGPLKGLLNILLTISTLKLGKGVLERVFRSTSTGGTTITGKDQVEEAQEKAKEDLSPEMEAKGTKEGRAWGEAFKRSVSSALGWVKTKLKEPLVGAAKAKDSNKQIQKDGEKLQSTVESIKEEAKKTANNTQTPVEVKGDLDDFDGNDNPPKNLPSGQPATNQPTGQSSKLGKVNNFGADMEKGLDSFNQKITPAIQTFTAFTTVATLATTAMAQFGWISDDTAASVSKWTIGIGAAISIIPTLVSGIKAIGTALKNLDKASLIVYAIVLALTAFVAAMALIAEYNRKQTTEYKLEQLAEATEKAGQAADEAKKKYDELANTKKQFDDMSNSLNGLTEGTLEWKRALIEANGQVMELLKTYPELSESVSRNSNGQLEISEAGWDMILEKQMKTAENTQALTAQMELETNELRKTQAREEALAAMKAAGVDKDETSRVLDAYLATGNITGIGNAKKGEVIAALGNYETTMGALEQSSQMHAETMMSNWLSEQSRAYSYTQDVVSGIAKFANNIPGGQWDVIRSGYGADSTKVQELIEGYGITAETNGLGNEAKLKKLYQAMTGATDEAIKDMTDDQIQKQIAQIDMAKISGQFVNDLVAGMQGLEPSDQKKLTALLSNDWKNMTADAIKQLGNYDFDGLLKKTGLSRARALEAMGYAADNIQNLSANKRSGYVRQHVLENVVGENGELTEDGLKFLQDNAMALGITNNAEEVITPEQAEEYMKRLLNNQLTDTESNALGTAFGNTELSAEDQFEYDQRIMRERAEKQLAEIQGKFTKYSSLNWNDFSGYTLGALSGLEGQMSKLGTRAATEYATAWKQIVDNKALTGGQQEQLAEYLANVDWSNMTEAVAAYDYMASLGLPTEQIEEFWNTATDGANTFVSSMAEVLQLTSRFQQMVASYNDLQKRLTEGTATWEDVLQLINAGADIKDFKIGAEGWSMDPSKIPGAIKQARQQKGREASAAVEQTKQEYNELKQHDQARGITQNEDGTFTVSGGALGSYLKADEATGKLVATKKVDAGNVHNLGQILGVKQGELSDEDYITAVQDAFDRMIALRNDGENIIFGLEQMAAYTNAAAYSADGIAMRPGGATDAEVRYAMQQEAADLGADVNEVTAYAERLGQIPGLSQQMADRIAVDQARINAGAKIIIDNLDKIEEGLSADPDTQAYSDAMEFLNKGMKTLMKTEEDFSDEFLKENAEIIKGAAKGIQKDMDALQKATAKYMLKTDKMDPTTKGKVEGAIDRLSQYNAEVGTQIDMDSIIGQDATEIYNQAYAQAIAAGKGAEDAIADANAAVEAAGGIQMPEMEATDLPYTTVTLTGPLPDGIAVNSTVNGITYSQVRGSDTYTASFPVFGAVKGAKGTKVSEKIDLGDGGSKGGGGSKWENKHDKLYNNYEEVNKLLRQREQIERNYDRLLRNRNVGYKDILANQKEELANLKAQREEQELIQAGKAKEIQDLISSKQGKKYAQYFSYDAETGEINIDWDKVNKLRGSKGEGFDEFLAKLEGLRDQWQESQDALDEIEDAVTEIKDARKDQYFELEDQIKDALIQERQDEIDKLSEINDSINDTNSKLLDSMQEQIDEYRQNRDNQKTEDEIADKQRRLAYLQQDTSGANAMEILNLQKEIEEAQEDYTDTLIDQKISELQKQNDQAAEQRQRQIEIMEAQLQYYEESGAVWQDVYNLLNDEESIDENGALKPNGPLAQLLQSAADYTGMSNLAQQEWWAETAQLVAEGLTHVHGDRTGEEGEAVTFTSNTGETISGHWDANGNVVDESGNVHEGVYQDMQGSWVQSEPPTEPEQDEPEKHEWNSSYTKPWDSSKTIKKGSAKKYVRGLQWALTELGYDPKGIDGSYGKNTAAAVSAFQADQEGWTPTGKAGPKTKEALSKLFQYKTGGLADFTGPAWLDGTKSRPEYILNADQTKAFFNLIDVLGSLQKAETKTTQNNGDNTFDIDINVESIGNDYDVEQLADKVKSLINEDARYRNNNAINLMR